MPKTSVPDLEPLLRRLAPLPPLARIETLADAGYPLRGLLASTGDAPPFSPVDRTRMLLQAIIVRDVARLMLAEFEGQRRLVRGLAKQIEQFSDQIRFWASSLDVAVPVELVD